MKVKYIGATETQIKFGSCENSIGVLKEGEVYEVETVETHSWHTKFHLKGYSGRGFNSVCFELLFISLFVLETSF